VSIRDLFVALRALGTVNDYSRYKQWARRAGVRPLPRSVVVHVLSYVRWAVAGGATVEEGRGGRGFTSPTPPAIRNPTGPYNTGSTGGRGF
jgi:hypothetical protein